MRKWLIISGLVVLLLVGSVFGAWLARGAILQSVLKSTCHDQNLVCTVEAVTVDLDQIVLTGLTVDDQSGTSIAKARVTVDLDWPGVLSPNLTAITVDNMPSVNVQFDGQNISFGTLSLADLSGSSGGGSGTVPPVTIENLDIIVSTPAGMITGQLTGQGQWPTQGELSVQLTPTQLEQDGHQITLTTGVVEVSLSDQQVHGTFDVLIKDAVLQDRKAQNIHLRGTLTDGEQPLVNWSLSADRLADRNRFEALGVDSSGQIDLFRRPTQEDRNWLALISRINASIQSGPTQIVGHSIGQLTGQSEASRQEPDDRFDLVSELAFTDGDAPFGTLQSGSLTFDGELDPETLNLRGQGGFLATNVAASPDTLNTVQALIPVSPPFSAHSKQLSRAVMQAVSGFSAGGDFNLSLGTDTPLTLSINSPIAIKAQSGARLLLSPTEGASPIIYNKDGLEIIGVVSMNGGGLPNATANLRKLSIQSDRLEVRSGGFELRDWTADGITLAAALTSLDIDYVSADDIQVRGDGEIHIDGPVTGVSLEAGHLFGSLSAARGQSGWRVQTRNNPCIGIEFQSIGLPGSIQIGETALRLCPPGGRVLSIVDGYPVGTLDLGNAVFPVTGKAFLADVQLANGVLEWRAASTLDIAIKAEQLHLPSSIDGRSLRLDGVSPELNLSFSDTPSIAVRLDGTKLSGDLIPARIDLGKLGLESQITASGFKGEATGYAVRISDIREDPMYEPLIGTFEARFNHGNMTLSGPLQLVGNGASVADVSAEIDLLRLNGTAAIRTPLLTFQKGGLQPRDLSDRVRGLLTNARGAMQAQADFKISAGQLSGTSSITMADLGFDTLRLGPVDGVNGTLYFDDIIGITTPPGQSVTIGKIDPGVMLTDGRLQFQILEEQQARLEAAEWPFAGGRLFVEPTLWTIAGTTDTINVKADKIELEALIEALNVPELQAAGTISGTFPIELRSGNTYIRDARFTVDEKGGTLRYTGSALNSVAGGNEIVGDAFRALQDLHYTVLELGLNGNLLGEITVQVLLLGRNPEVLSGAEFEFDVTIDSELAQLLQAGQRATSSEWLAEAVAKQVIEGPSPQE